jgi:peptide/nickel transport system permease protein/oligopeptide transport system permease protein
MRPYLLLVSLALLALGIVSSLFSIQTFPFSVVDYGNSSVAMPPSGWEYQYWAVLSKGYPNSTVITSKGVTQFQGVHPLKLNDTELYIYVVKGYVQPLAYLSVPSIFLIFLGTALGFRGTILLIQERELGELSRGNAVSSSIYKYALKRFSSLVISLVVVVAVVALLETVKEFTPSSELLSLLTFNMGLSKQGVSVDSLILTSLSYSSFLTGISFSPTVYTSSLLVMYAIRKKGFTMSLIQKWKYIGNALASWVIGIALLYAFHYNFPVFPVGSPNGDLLPYLVLPAVSLFFSYIGIFANRVVYTVLSTPPLVTKAKGLSEDIVMYRHVLGNLMVVTLSSISSALVEMLVAEFLIETIFSWPGLGYLLGTSVDAGDIRVVEGVLLIYSTIVLVSNFLADLVYGIADPRVRR